MDILLHPVLLWMEVAEDMNLSKAFSAGHECG